MREHSRIAIRTLAVVVGCVLYFWLGHNIYAPDLEAGNHWMLGPLSKRLSDAAQERIGDAYEAINDHSLPARERLRLHHRDLRAAEKLILASLRSQPAQAGAIAQLAAMRWEVDPPLSPEANRRHTQLVDLASGMAPTIPSVQMQLCELLLNMGRREEALTYGNTVVRLKPELAPEVVTMLRERMLGPREIFDGLPRTPLVVTAVKQPFLEEGKTEDYIAIVESTLDELAADAPWHLIKSYGDACLHVLEPGRLREKMNTIGPLDDPVADAERLLQLSRSHLASGYPHLAVEAAAAARRKRPDEAGVAEYHGYALHAAGEWQEAIEAYRDALGMLARQSGDPEARAKLYSRIGQSEESRGRIDQAYDAYVLALQLDPEEAYAKRRLEEMKEAAGLD